MMIVYQNGYKHSQIQCILFTLEFLYQKFNKQMDAIKFNQLILEVYEHYLDIQQIRQQLSKVSKYELLQAVIKIDPTNKSYITIQDIVQFISFSHTSSSIDIKSILKSIFPFSQISYSTIVAHCTHKQNNYSFKTTNFLQKKFNQLSTQHLISKLITLELILYSKLPSIIELIPNYIPYQAEKITQKDFKQYFKSQNITFDSDIMLKMLNYGIQKQKELIHIYKKDRLKKIEGNEENIQYRNKKTKELINIVKRIEQRIHKFGNQWLHCN